MTSRFNAEAEGRQIFLSPPGRGRPRSGGMKGLPGRLALRSPPHPALSPVGRGIQIAYAIVLP
jgi:hypothetical protein